MLIKGEAIPAAPAPEKPAKSPAAAGHWMREETRIPKHKAEGPDKPFAGMVVHHIDLRIFFDCACARPSFMDLDPGDRSCFLLPL